MAARTPVRLPHDSDAALPRLRRTVAPAIPSASSCPDPLTMLILGGGCAALVEAAEFIA